MSAARAPDEARAAPETKRLLRILFLARELRIGGAERQLCLLARGLAERGHKVAIGLFYRGGELERDLEGSAVELIGLGKGGRYELLSTLRGLERIAREFRPDLVHGYLPIPNLMTLALRRGRRGPRIVWGVRATTLELSRYDRLTRLSYRLEARLARRADLIIANSRSGLAQAAEAGFPRERLVYIPNGIDSERFRADPGARERARRAWGVAANEFVVGAVARIDPMKDFGTFLAAVALAAKARPGLRAVAIAVGSEAQRARLARDAAELGIGDRLVLPEPSADIAEILNGFDLYCSSSAYGEGFPNTVAEAMASALPCLVTAVGDGPELVGEAGRVVPPRDPRAAAEAILEIAGLEPACRREIGERLRRRAAEFTPERLVLRTEAAFAELVRPRTIAS